MKNFLILVLFFIVSCGIIGKNVKEKPPITPYWALGHIVWEDSINTQNSAVDLIKQYREHNIPVSGIIIDSPWSMSYNDFNWDKLRYPEPDKMIKGFMKENIRTILWLTGCINSTAKDVPLQLSPEYDYAKKQKYVINNGKESHWWKGNGLHLDFTNKEAVKWWNNQLDKVFTDGVYGWKVDQGEAGFGDTVITSTGKKSLDEFKKYYYNSMFDYATSHKNGEGMILARPYSHQAKNSGFCAAVPKMSVGWCGDFQGNWEGLKLQINNIYISAEAGYGALACEIGGFQSARSNKAQLIRYVQFASMVATMINGGANGAFTNHLPWYHDRETADIYRFYTNLHYELRGYIFSELVNAHQNSGSLLKNVSIKDESHMLGNDIFFKAITSDTNLISVTLPKSSDWIDFWTNNKYPENVIITKEYSLDKAPIFIKAGAIIPLEIKNSVTGLGNKSYRGKITVLIYPDKKSRYVYHKPLGDGTAYKDIEFIYNNGKISVKSDESESFVFLIKTDENQIIKNVEGCDTFRYDPQKRLLEVEKKGKDFDISIVMK